MGFIAVFLTAVNAIGGYLSLNDPALLERRKNVGPVAEQSPVQRIIISIAIVSTIAMLIFCALAHRFGWTQVPAGVSLVGDALVALGLFLNLLVFNNTFANYVV